MAKIYGRSECERIILDKLSIPLDNFRDFQNLDNNLNKELKDKRRLFLKNLPNRVKKEEIVLVKIQKDKNILLKRYSLEKNKIKKEISLNQSKNKIFGVLINYFYLFFNQYIKKNYFLFKLNKSIKLQENILNQWKNNSEDIFNSEQIELLTKINEFKEIKKDPFYFGTIGELKVLNKLSYLDEEFKILCGVNIVLDEWYHYNGDNIKSAQIDFIVLSRKGIFLIEVKNWGDKFKRSHDLSPYKQIDRSSKVLYFFIKNRLNKYIAKKIKKVLVSTNKNFSYNSNYPYISVLNLSNLNNFLYYSKKVFSYTDVEDILEILIPHVTS